MEEEVGDGGNSDRMTKTVVWYARSAASTPSSGRWQAHPRDGGLLFAYLVALSVGSECMGVVMKIWDMSRPHK